VTAPTPPRARKPRKVVSEVERVDALMDELRAGEELIQTAMRRRLDLALEANELGMTTTRIAEAVGVSQTSVSNWVRAAKARSDHLDS